MNRNSKKKIIATLLRAKRPDLANAVAGTKVVAMNQVFYDYMHKAVIMTKGTVKALLMEQKPDQIAETLVAIIKASVPQNLQVKVMKAMRGLMVQPTPASTVTAKKPHFEPSQFVREYEEQVGLLAQNNYGPWKNTQEAEQHVKKAIQEYAQNRYDDVVESFKGPNDIKYIVEEYLYVDDPDPYGKEPSDPKLGKKIEQALAKLYGKDWKKISGVRQGKGDHMTDGDPKAWIVWIEGHDTETAMSLAPKLQRALGNDAGSVEPYDHVTVVVHP